MGHIELKKGLDIPIKGKPSGGLQELAKPKTVSLDVDAFDEMKFKLLVKVGDSVRIGQPLLKDKACEGRLLVSPGSGRVSEVCRGLKRRLIAIVIELDKTEEQMDHGTLNLAAAQREELVEKFLAAGIFAHIRMRPYNILARPNLLPKSIFVKAVETAPFAPTAELQVKGYESDFQTGLQALAKLTDGDVHLVYHKDSTSRAFMDAEHVKKHTVNGPHPAGNTSVHIHNIDPIEKNNEVVWTVTVTDVLVIGHLVRTGNYFIDRVISVAGTGVIPKGRGFYKARAGFPVESLIDRHNAPGPLRMISGSVLTGKTVEGKDCMGFYDNTFTVIPEQVDRELLHFFRLGANKFTNSRTYLSGYMKGSSKEYDFTTSRHGEERGFIDCRHYDKVMPMRIPTMHLVKAVLANDVDLAEHLGILEVDSEDFALATFVCPSKIEMSEIIKDGLKAMAAEAMA